MFSFLLKNSKYTAFWGLIFLVGCKKTDREKLNNYAYEYSQVLSGFLDIYTVIAQYNFVTNSFTDSNFFCDDFVLTTGKQETIFNFGDNCICKDGLVRKGIITLIKDTNSTQEVNVEARINQYGLNKLTVDGNVKLLHSTKNSTLTVSETNGSCFLADGIIQYNETGKLTLISGKETRKITDDIFTYETVCNVTSKSKDNFKVTTKKALIKKNSCEWISHGQFLIQKDGESDQLLDFGTNLCDDEASVEIEKDIFIFILN